MAHKTFRILNVEINFPFEPYGIQKGMFGKLITSLTNKEHLLLESPTGTGKTLVLLCSALAWQAKSKAEKEPFLSPRLREKLIELKKAGLAKKLKDLALKPCKCGRRPNRKKIDDLKESKENNRKKGRKCSDASDDDSSCLKKAKIENQNETEDLQHSPYFDKTKKPSKEVVDEDIIILDDESDLCENCRALNAEQVFFDELSTECPSLNLGRIPKIYYGTRTHKQITQVVRELNKTPYKDNLRMCVLSSRERTCINPAVKDLPNKNDRCKELVQNNSNGFFKKPKDQESCPWHPDSNYVEAKFEFINDEYSDKAWDIEDAAQFGLSHTACPYYGVRSLQGNADITFCPYNYLLDPTIRSTLSIDLTNAIIIIDEAHNIEDICRESASFVIDTKQIDDIIETIQISARSYVQGSTITDAYDFFRERLLNVKSFLQRLPFTEMEKLSSQDCIARKVMNQNEMVRTLDSLRLGSNDLKDIRANLETLKGDDEDGAKQGPKAKDDDDQSSPALSFNQLQYLTQLTMTLEYMFSQDNKYLNDFRLVVAEFLERDYFKFKQPGFSTAIIAEGDSHLWQLSLLCMNPGVTFEQVSSNAWSIIVASGTLSPIQSLKSELGCEFRNDFEGSHVVPSEQIFATILSRGPSGGDLNCAYAHSLKLPFQDEVGEIVRDVCKTVPNGVLCFFPSYDRMENLYKRWFDKGFIREIQQVGKKLFREKKNLSPADFEKELKKYNALAQTKGALLFAVFRGKVSEGIDFADKAARAVITIGIPYPNFKEITVDLKKSYNDETRRRKPELMSGGDWYASQGFRALNQALGRCIRHRQDWGAIIMIDSRLNSGFCRNSISRWLRQVLKFPENYRTLAVLLENFVEKRIGTNQDQAGIQSRPIIEQEDDPEICLDLEDL